MSDNNNLPTTDAARRLAELKRQRELAKAGGAGSNALANIPNHITLCIDVSSSMAASFPIEYKYDSETRANAARRAMRHMVTGSDPNTTAYSLVLFGGSSYSGGVRVAIPKTTTYTAFHTTEIRPEGGTPMNEGLLLSIEQAPQRIVLLSDGEPNHKPTEAVMVAKQRGIKIDTISIGGADDTLMKWIAAETGGVWQRCDNPEQLAEHFLMLEPRNYLQIEHK